MMHEPGGIGQNASDGSNEHTTNGVQDSDDGEGTAEGEGESDDDMMDRISSSPSIDDDGGFLPSSPPSVMSVTPTLSSPLAWPDRKSSLTPELWIETSFNESSHTLPASLSPSTTDCFPMLSTPVQSPLVKKWKDRFRIRLRSPLASSPLRLRDTSSSPFTDTPTHLPLILNQTSPSPSEHHHEGRYALDNGTAEERSPLSETWTTGGQSDESSWPFTPAQDSTADHPPSAENLNVKANRTDDSPTRSPIASPFRRHSLTRSTEMLASSALESSPSYNSLNSERLGAILLPAEDPLLEDNTSITSGHSSFSDQDSWESASDFEEDSAAFSDRDPCHRALHDDAKDILLDPPKRGFTAHSSLSRDCLPITEDIDFAFVYALHTFVASVEGQANATKGDTMVLLDDTNSYWWLVRVVKDSSIGEQQKPGVFQDHCTDRV